MNSLKGILPALVTPLRSDGSLQEATVPLLLERVFAAGCHGTYLAGSTGEGWLLPLELREQLCEAVCLATPPGRGVIVHVGAASTRDAVRGIGVTHVEWGTFLRPGIWVTE